LGQPVLDRPRAALEAELKHAEPTVLDEFLRLRGVAEFRGLARAARQRFLVAALETGPLMKAIVEAAQAQYRGRTTNVPLRLVQSVAARWADISRAGCLSQTIVLDRRTLEISDIRVTGSTATSPTWDGNEIGICIIRNNLQMKKTGMVWIAPILAGVSLHALGRFHQRAWIPSPEGLLDDLKILSEAAPGIIASMARTFELPTPNGAFKGHLAVSPDAPDAPYLNVRTFVH
jgi:hypothetical protein